MSTAEALLTPEIRRMQDSDLDMVMEIERESFSTPWSRGTFRGLLQRSDASLWVAQVGERVVGYAVVWYLFRDGGARKPGGGPRLASPPPGDTATRLGLAEGM